MKHHISPFLLILCIFHQNTFLASTNATDDLLNQTCKKCAEMSPNMSYDFCVTSLQVAVPHDQQSLTVEELGILALKLAIANASHTVTSVQEMLTSKAFDPYSTCCLRDCLELYSDAISVLDDSIQAFRNKSYYKANIWISAAAEAAETCEEGFKEESGGEVSPLGKEDADFFQLCDIALVITNLLSFPSPQIQLLFKTA